MKRLYAATLLLSLFPLWAQGQTFGVDLNKEKELFAATKQVNQFFRRFNAEESPKGERYYEGEAGYREETMRKRWIASLFDAHNSQISQAQKEYFIADITTEHPQFLDFHKGQWFAEVKTIFSINGKEEVVQLFLKLQQEPIGSKWVISGLFSPRIYSYFASDSIMLGKFLHPMSHELDFMNLNKVFNGQTNLASYLERSYQPDLLSIFLYEYKRGIIQYVSIREVQFHFFQLNNWYFKVQNFNRSGTNSGWLISQLRQMEQTEKAVYQQLIFYEKD